MRLADRISKAVDAAARFKLNLPICCFLFLSKTTPTGADSTAHEAVFFRPGVGGCTENDK